MNRTEEERRRLLALFDEQARSFRRLAAFFLGPALLFGVLIFAPFSRQVGFHGRIQAELESTRAVLASKVDSLAGVAAVDSLVEALRIRQRVRGELEVRLDLREALAAPSGAGTERMGAWATGEADIDLRSEAPDVAQRFAANVEARRATACVWVDDRRWRECFERATRVCAGRACAILHQPYMRQEVEGGPSAGASLDEALAGELLDSLGAVHRVIREELPPLRLLADGTPDAYFRLASTWEGLAARVSDRAWALRRAIEPLARDSAALAAELERTERLIHVIERSGGGLETPLGPLPVGMRELVFLYPTLLGVAYLLCLLAFHRMILLRRGYHELSVELDGGSRDNGSHLALSAPLWYEPLRPAGSQAVRVLVALAPPAFMVWGYLALKSLAGVVPDSDSRFGATAYELFLLVTFLAVAAALVRVTRAATAYGRAGLSRSAAEAGSFEGAPRPARESLAGPPPGY